MTYVKFQKLYSFLKKLVASNSIPEKTRRFLKPVETSMDFVKFTKISSTII